MEDKLKIERSILNITQEKLAQKNRGFSPNDKLHRKEPVCAINNTSAKIVKVV
jgi:hypothetical protein